MAYVYLICDSSKDNAYKIGVTRGNLENRMKKLQTGNSGEVFLCKTYETEYPFFIEKQLHRKYHHKKIMNEWFALDDLDVFSFEEACKNTEDIIKIMENNPFFPKNIK